jgi:phenylacetate-CoA ligase
MEDVIASFSPRTTGEMVILLDKPGPNVEPPLRVQVEYAQGTENLSHLKKAIEEELRNKLVFRADVQLVPEGTLPRYEMKATLVRKLYEEEEERCGCKIKALRRCYNEEGI